MLIRLILVSLFLTAVFGGLFGWKAYTAQRAATAQSGGPPPTVIAATEARREEWQSYLQVVGSLSAVAGIEVASEVGGQIRAIHFASGQPVEEGELLLELDDQTDAATLKGLVAERTLARLRFERLAKLLRDKSISKSDYDEARAMLDGASAEVAAQQALLEKKRIRAPFAGRLGIRRVDIGEYLTAGAAIVPLEKLDPIFVDFTLPERELSRISVEQSIEVQVQAYPGERFSGRIRAIDPGVVVGSRSFRVQAEMPNAQERLRPGMFADVRVIFDEKDQVITIPDTAISYAPYGDSVFVLNEADGETRVERRQIQTGEQRGGWVAVRSGLSAGDRVVSAGHNKLRNGQAVQVDDRRAPGERMSAAVVQ
jgi:membrane fusion protein (multidrug efflux system)